MAVKSVLLKLSPEVHGQIVDAAKLHKRSMQSVLVSLIESWLAAGAPDPITFFDRQAGKTADGSPQGAIDTGARTAIEEMTRKLRDIQQHVLGIDAPAQPIDPWSERVLSELKDIDYPTVRQRDEGYRIRRRQPEPGHEVEEQTENQ
jgi:hypothetical protein